MWRNKCLPRGSHDPRETAFEDVNDLTRVVDRECGLCQVGELVGVCELQRLRIGDRFDEDRSVGRLAERAFHLFVSRMSDEDDAIPRPREAGRFRVHLRHERTRRVDHAQLASFSAGPDGRRHSVCGEYEGFSVRYVTFGVDEDSAFALELGHGVHDLFPDVDWRTEVGERAPYDLDGSVYTCAVPSRCRKQHLLDHTTQCSYARALACASQKKGGGPTTRGVAVVGRSLSAHRGPCGQVIPRSASPSTRQPSWLCFTRQ